MSIQSPAKQERIERHLMRQRGAGSRTVSATFGFSFGSSAPTSTEHTPTASEPSAKRRKTLLRNELCVEDSAATQFESNQISAVDNFQQKKPRKRWIPPLDSATTSRSQARDVDDSFIRLGVKQAKKVKKPQQPEEEVDPAATLPATKGRPKRRAAAEAAVKVADDLVEERLPVDKKRQPVEVEPNSRKPNKSRKRLDVPVEVVPPPPETVDALSSASRLRITQKDLKVKAKSAQQKEPEESLSPRCDQPRKTVIDEEVPRSKPKVANGRKRKADAEATQPAVVDEPESVYIKTSKRTVDENENVTPTSGPDFNGVVTKSKKKASWGLVAVQEPATKRAQESLRAPLKESDVNATIRSTSPEKPKAKGTKATSKSETPTETAKSANEFELERTRPAKRRKVQVRQDEEVPEDLSKAATVAAADKQVGTAALTGSVNDETKRTGQKKQIKHPAPVQEALAQEEDIGWLFQSQDVKQRPALLRKPPATLRKGPRTPRKLVDIDLDDLLSNIASFAKTEGQTRDGGGPISKGEAAKITAGSQKRGKR